MGRMEHRCGTRYPVSAAVTLNPRGSGPIQGRIREASISGMFVETAPEMFLDSSVIGVEVTLPGTAALRTFRWQAMVVRRTGTGLGLMFDRVRPPAIARLLAGAQGELPASVPPAPNNVTPLRRSKQGTQPQP